MQAMNMDGFSLDIRKEQIEKLKELFPEVVSEDKIDWERLKATLGEDVTIQNERYVLNWAGKSDAFKTLQTGTSATLVPCKEESVNFDTTENIFIEGENLEVLKALQKSYFGKIKCIIIDPPYNTGSDSFVYPDKFSETKEEYMQRVGDKDEEGYLMKEGLFRKNSKENGQYHSNWLSMMYPRLFLAKNLLRDDGVIFVHIDDNEVHNLRLLMNEVFGEENYVAQIVWQKKTGAGAKTKGFITLHEYVLCYAKNFTQEWDIEIPYSDKTRAMYNKRDEHFNSLGPFATWPLNTTSMDERKNLCYPIIYNGIEIWPKKQWLWSKDKVEKAQKENKLVFNLNEKEGTYTVRFKGYLNDEDGNERKGKPLSVSVGPYTQEGTKDFEGIFDNRDIFPFPKPVSFIKQLINITIMGVQTKEDIFLDFFAGSGTTGHAVLDLNNLDSGNRKFILVQLPEKCDESSEAYKAGYKTIADIGKERIRRVLKKIEEERKPNDQMQMMAEEQTELDLGFKVFKLKPSNFKEWRPQIENIEELTTQIEEFIDPIKPESLEENILFELLLKSGYDLNSKIDVRQINGTKYYLINDGEMAIQLSGTPSDIIDELISLKPKKVIILDRLFENNDKLKTNTFLQFKDAGMDFRTV